MPKIKVSGSPKRVFLTFCQLSAIVLRATKHLQSPVILGLCVEQFVFSLFCIELCMFRTVFLVLCLVFSVILICL
jgi:hypothetical protein